MLEITGGNFALLCTLDFRDWWRLILWQNRLLPALSMVERVGRNARLSRRCPRSLRESRVFSISVQLFFHCHFLAPKIWSRFDERKSSCRRVLAENAT